MHMGIPEGERRKQQKKYFLNLAQNLLTYLESSDNMKQDKYQNILFVLRHIIIKLQKIFFKY